MSIPELILDPSNDSILPILENFLDRPRRLKYDEYNGKLYHVIWTADADKLRKEHQLSLRRQKYQDAHPPRPKPTISLYLRKKQKRIEEKSQPKEIIGNFVITAPNPFQDLHGNTIHMTGGPLPLRAI
jgi:hypothetical protein